MDRDLAAVFVRVCRGGICINGANAKVASVCSGEVNRAKRAPRCLKATSLTLAKDHAALARADSMINRLNRHTCAGSLRSGIGMAAAK